MRRIYIYIYIYIRECGSTLFRVDHPLPIRLI